MAGIIENPCMYTGCQNKQQWQVRAIGNSIIEHDPYMVCHKHLADTCIFISDNVQNNGIRIEPIFSNWNGNLGA